MVKNYKELEIFHLSYQLVLKLYPYLDKFPESEHKNFVLQMKRSVVSIPFNIAEGSSRKTDREFLSFLGYSFGSAKELEVALNLSRDLGFLGVEAHDSLFEDLQKLIAKLVLFTQHLEKGVPPKKDVIMGRMLRGDFSWDKNIINRVPH